MNWSGFPLTLYYDQSLSNPFSNSKENGVPYYDVEFNEDSSTVTLNGEFTLDNHVRSSIIRNCFQYYNITSNDNISIFSTSKGLICKFTTFNLIINTPYKIENHNADSFNSDENQLIWNFNNNNYQDKSVYFEIDFSKLYNGENNNEYNNNALNINSENFNFYIILILISIVTIFLIVIYFILKNKKKKASEL